MRSLSVNRVDVIQNRPRTRWRVAIFVLLSSVFVVDMLILSILFVAEWMDGRFSGILLGALLIFASLSSLTICQTIIDVQTRKRGVTSDRILRYRGRAIMSLVASAGAGALGMGIEQRDPRTLFVGLFISVLYLWFTVGESIFPNRD